MPASQLYAVMSNCTLISANWWFLHICISCNKYKDTLCPGKPRKDFRPMRFEPRSLDEYLRVYLCGYLGPKPVVLSDAINGRWFVSRVCIYINYTSRWMMNMCFWGSKIAQNSYGQTSMQNRVQFDDLILFVGSVQQLRLLGSRESDYNLYGLCDWTAIFHLDWATLIHSVAQCVVP